MHKFAAEVGETFLISLLSDHGQWDLIEKATSLDQRARFLINKQELEKAFALISLVEDEDSRMRLLLEHAARLSSVKGFFPSLRGLPLERPEQLISSLLKCPHKAEAIDFAEYLSSLCDSKLIYDCQFELVCEDKALISNFLAR